MSAIPTALEISRSSSLSPSLSSSSPEPEITDDQIRDLRSSRDWPEIWLREFAIALGEATSVNHPIEDRRDARRRCAAETLHRREVWQSLTPSQRVFLLRAAGHLLAGATIRDLRRAGLVDRSTRVFAHPSDRVPLVRKGLLNSRDITQLGRCVAALGASILRVG